MKTPEYEVTEGFLSTKTMTLEIQRFAIQYQFDPSEMLRGAQLRRWNDEMMCRMVAEMVVKIAAKKYDIKTITFPADWWQSLKKRWFPRWARDRWPVKYTEVTMEANAYYPEITIPDRATFVHVEMMVRARD